MMVHSNKTLTFLRSCVFTLHFCLSHFRDVQIKSRVSLTWISYSQFPAQLMSLLGPHYRYYSLLFSGVPVHFIPFFVSHSWLYILLLSNRGGYFSTSAESLDLRPTGAAGQTGWLRGLPSSPSREENHSNTELWWPTCYRIHSEYAHIQHCWDALLGQAPAHGDPD